MSADTPELSDGEITESRFWIDKPGVEEYIDVTASVRADRAARYEAEYEVSALRARVAELEQMLDLAADICLDQEGAHDQDAAALTEERERLHKANDALATEIEELTREYDGETCPRVQCRNAVKKLRAELAQRTQGS